MRRLLGISLALLALVVSGVLVAGPVLSQIDDALSPARGAASVIAHGIASLPEGQLGWRVTRAATPAGPDQTRDYPGFLLAENGALLVNHSDTDALDAAGSGRGALPPRGNPVWRGRDRGPTRLVLPHRSGGRQRGRGRRRRRVAVRRRAVPVARRQPRHRPRAPGAGSRPRPSRWRCWPRRRRSCFLVTSGDGRSRPRRQRRGDAGSAGRGARRGAERRRHRHRDRRRGRLCHRRGRTRRSADPGPGGGADRDPGFRSPRPSPCRCLPAPSRTKERTTRPTARSPSPT